MRSVPLRCLKTNKTKRKMTEFNDMPHSAERADTQEGRRGQPEGNAARGDANAEERSRNRRRSRSRTTTITTIIRTEVLQMLFWSTKTSIITNSSIFHEITSQSPTQTIHINCRERRTRRKPFPLHRRRHTTAIF